MVSGGGRAWVAQLVERVLGKDEVTGSIPVIGSRNFGGGSNSVVESQPSKLLVAGSIPVSRSRELSPLSFHPSALAAPRLRAERGGIFVGPM